MLELTHSTTKGRCAYAPWRYLVALVVANTAAHEGFIEFWHTEVSFELWRRAQRCRWPTVNDVLMAIFFLLVGLEIKYEMTVGELTDVRQAIRPSRPLLAAREPPVGIYLLFNASRQERAIPTTLKYQARKQCRLQWARPNP